MDTNNNSNSYFRALFNNRSSSLSIAERICAACIPLIAIIEAAVFSIAGCCEKRQLPRKCRLAARDPSRLANESRFTVNEIEALHELYDSLSCSIIKDGLIHKEELQLALFHTRIEENLFLDREFVRTLSVFHPYAPVEEKIDFLFRLYDLRQTGYIEREEVRQMVVALWNEFEIKLPDDDLESTINETFADADTDKDGRINKEEWKAFVIRNPSLLKNMTLPCLKDISTI